MNHEFITHYPRAAHCASCGHKFYSSQVRFQHHNIKGEVCEECDSKIERKRLEFKRRPACECSATGPVCNEHSPADTSAILPRCECGHHRECHKEEA